MQLARPARPIRWSAPGPRRARSGAARRPSPALGLAALLLVVGCGDTSGAGPDEAPTPADNAPASDTAGPGGAASPGDGGVSAAAPAPPAWRPNVVVYLIDTLRADRLGLYGHDRDTSPALDQLGGESAVFERAFSQGPWTLPSVISLFTSAYPTSHEMTSATSSLDETAVTLTEWFADQGYATAGFVHNTLGGHGSGLDQGYETFVERPPLRDMTDEMRAAGLHTMRPVMDFFRDYDDERPFFAYIHTVEPHWPYEGKLPGDAQPFTDSDPASWQALNDAVYEQRVLLQQASAEGLSDAEAARLVEIDAELADKLDIVWALYDADVRRADHALGRVHTALRYYEHWDDTIFIALSDHGEEFLEHGLWFHDQSVFNELVRVPLVLRVPGLTDAGLRIDTPVQLIDLAPTLAELLGAPPLDSWQGRSLAPLMRDPGAGASWPPAISMRINVDRHMGGERGDRETALVDGDDKVIVHHDHGATLLFDLAEDPGEQHDVAAARPERAAALRKELLDRVRSYPPLGVRKEQDVSDEKLQHLIELGYVEKDRH